MLVIWLQRLLAILAVVTLVLGPAFTMPSAQAMDMPDTLSGITVSAPHVPCKSCDANMKDGMTMTCGVSCNAISGIEPVQPPVPSAALSAATPTIESHLIGLEIAPDPLPPRPFPLS